MSGTDASGSVLAWVIPPSVDPESAALSDLPYTDVRLLADDLETACGPEDVDVEIIPVGVRRISLRFADRLYRLDQDPVQVRRGDQQGQSQPHHEARQPKPEG